MTAIAELRAPKAAGIWVRHPDDWYVEAEWCSHRLLETELRDNWHQIIDPACGGGRIIKVARGLGFKARGSDIADRGSGEPVTDFLDPESYIGPADHVVSNPPFELAEQFVQKALRIVRYRTAMLLPATWHCGDRRSRWLETTPLRKVLFLTPRPTMEPGLGLAPGQKLGGGTKDFAWFLWEQGFEGRPELGWLRRDA